MFELRMTLDAGEVSARWVRSVFAIRGNSSTEPWRNGTVLGGSYIA
jgi:hypothetical protein